MTSPQLLSLLNNPPAVGDGRHNWLFRVGLNLKREGYQASAISDKLRAICDHCGWDDRKGKTVDDIVEKLFLSLDWLKNYRPQRWPEVNHDKRWALSKVAPLFDPEGNTGLTATDVLPLLFAPDDLICIGWRIDYFRTLPFREAIERAPSGQYIVPNRMVARFAENGSHRCLKNASPLEDRKYIVVEFDQGEPKVSQAAVLSALHSNQVPLIMAVWSAGKSIHGWYDVSGVDSHNKLSFFRYAVHLGADKTLWDISKLVRMPGGIREGRRQTILYFRKGVS